MSPLRLDTKKHPRATDLYKLLALRPVNPGTGLSTNGRFFLQFAKVDPKLERFSSYGLGIEAALAVAAMAVSTASVR